MSWTEATISGLPADCRVPAERRGPGAIVFLHGIRGETLRHSEEFARQLDAVGLPVVCPRAGACWWTGVESPGFGPHASAWEFVTDGVLPWIAGEWGVASPLVALLGVSTGGQGALGLAYRQPRKFPVVAAISPAIDVHLAYGKGFGVEELYASEDAARQDTVTLNLHPLNWPRFQYFCCDPEDATWHDGCERLASKLRSSGVPFAADLTTRAGGHGWSYFDARAEAVLGWIRARLAEVAASPEG